jgi:hypothetical protein
VTIRSPTAITWQDLPHYSAIYSLKQVEHDTPDLTIAMPIPIPEPHTTIPLSALFINNPTFSAKSG